MTFLLCVRFVGGFWLANVQDGGSGSELISICLIFQSTD